MTQSLSKTKNRLFSPLGESWNEGTYEFQPHKQLVVIPSETENNTILAHEWGHVLICETLGRYSPEWKTWYGEVKERANFFNSLTIKIEEEAALLRSELGRYMAVGPKGAKSFEEYGEMLKSLSRRIEEKETELHKVQDKVTSEFGAPKEIAMLNLSLPYQELYADLVAVADSGNPNAIAEVLGPRKGSKFNGREFMIESGQEMDFLTSSNPSHLPSDPHLWFTETRRFLWAHYLSKPNNKSLLNSLVQTIEKAICEEIVARQRTPLPQNKLEASLQSRLVAELSAFGH